MKTPHLPPSKHNEEYHLRSTTTGLCSPLLSKLSLAASPLGLPLSSTRRSSQIVFRNAGGADWCREGVGSAPRRIGRVNNTLQGEIDDDQQP